MQFSEAQERFLEKLHTTNSAKLAAEQVLKRPTVKLPAADQFRKSAQPRLRTVQVIADGAVQSVLAWLSSGGAAARAFRQWKGKDAHMSQTVLRDSDRQLLAEVDKLLHAAWRQLPGHEDEVRPVLRSFCQKEVRQAVSARSKGKKGCKCAEGLGLLLLQSIFAPALWDIEARRECYRSRKGVAVMLQFALQQYKKPFFAMICPSSRPSCKLLVDR